MFYENGILDRETCPFSMTVKGVLFDNIRSRTAGRVHNLVKLAENTKLPQICDEEYALK